MLVNCQDFGVVARFGLAMAELCWKVRGKRVTERSRAKHIGQTAQYVVGKKNGFPGIAWHSSGWLAEVEAPIALQWRWEAAPQRAKQAGAKVPMAIGENGERCEAAVLLEFDGRWCDGLGLFERDKPGGVNDVDDVALECEVRQPGEDAASDCSDVSRVRGRLDDASNSTGLGVL